MGSFSIGGYSVGTDVPGGVQNTGGGINWNDPVSIATGGVTSSSGIKSTVSGGARTISGAGSAVANATGQSDLIGGLGRAIGHPLNIGGAVGQAGNDIGEAGNAVNRVGGGLLTAPGGGLGNLQNETGLPNAQLPQLPTLGANSPALQSPTAISPDPTPAAATTSVQQSMAASEAAAQAYATQLTSAEGLLQAPTTSSRILGGH